MWKTIYKYWMKFAHVLGAINGRILLFIFYFVVVGIYSIISLPFVLIKKRKERRTYKESYWISKNAEKVNEEILLQQF